MLKKKKTWIKIKHMKIIEGINYFKIQELLNTRNPKYEYKPFIN